MAASIAGPDAVLPDIVNRYWQLAPEEKIRDRPPAQMYSAARAHLELAQQRLPGEAKLRVEQSRMHVVVQTVTDDKPFIVDSILAAMTEVGLEVDLMVHPLVAVRRDDLGKLVEVRPHLESDEAAGDNVVESWMHLEAGPLHYEAPLGPLRDRIQQVLTDVRDAVEDWAGMRNRALTLADELAYSVVPVPEQHITDSIAMLRWLTEDNFTFVGYREYRIVDRHTVESVAGTGLGTLRRDPSRSKTLLSLSREARARITNNDLLTITKVDSRSTVHRSAYLDYVGLKTLDGDGNVVGEHCFLGLFSSQLTQMRDLPAVKRKIEEVVVRSGLSRRGRSGKNLMAILENYPSTELFQISADDLFRTVMGVLRMAWRWQVQLFARKDPYSRFISCLVYLPRDRFTTDNCVKIQRILLRELAGTGVDSTARVTDSVLARIHFMVLIDPAAEFGEIDAEALSGQIADAIQHWDDEFALTLKQIFGEEQATHLHERYRTALPDTYKDSHSAYEAAQDVARFERVAEPGQLVVGLFERPENDSDMRFKVYGNGERMILSAVLPVLHSMGVQVRDQRLYEILRADSVIHLHDFGLSLPAGAHDVTKVRANVEDAFLAAWRGESEADRFNELVVRAGLTWRQVVVLRAYARYLRQTGSVFSQRYMESTLAAYPEIAARLVALFEARFDPASDGDLGLVSREIADSIRGQLDSVPSLDQDRILRSFLGLIGATVRTSFFQRSAEGGARSCVAFKFDSPCVPDLPAPRPRSEIFVYSPRFEGIHMRFGPVARGGIRWSDRRADFRTEVLGLAKAQMVKNAVIAPVGAKGGFVLKRPRPGSDQETYRSEGIACYRQFISAMLQLTDNLVDGIVVPPEDVVRHDGDDPYLVVAPDKGTATFSDVANEISLAYGFWLGDAFASGGSDGYDHKQMGITARGAWEFVKRRFHQMNVNIEATDFTVVGIGDMSGDVFGNAMLLSEHIRLVAAFDHRHIFVDPSPDTVPSYVERQRLFNLPRSSWDDYDRTRLSPGGGIWPRTAKAIPISEQMRLALGINDDAQSLPASELIRSILKAPVDLLWNGGIGTYVKAETESHSQVGDKANDGVRVNGAQVRATVVGEGGNLGLTQRGRVEYALKGGRQVAGRRQAHICTDFIDNSAGVNCSDHEVNIKVLLDGAVVAGDMTPPARDKLLRDMTEEVADLVLRDNHDQACTLELSGLQAASRLAVHQRMLTILERAGQLDRALATLPSDEELEARAAAGVGLTVPELAALLAYTKIAARSEVHESALVDEEWTLRLLVDYFPTQLRAAYTDRIVGHRLRREIVTTVVVNEVVNRAGLSFAFRASEETGATLPDLLRAYMIVRDAFDLPSLWRALESEDTTMPAATRTAVYLEVRRLIDRAVRWLVTSCRSPLDVLAETRRLRTAVAELLPSLYQLFHGRMREAVHERAAALAKAGTPPELAERITLVASGFGLLDIVETSHTSGCHVREVAGVYYVLSEKFRVDDLLTKISDLAHQERWQTLIHATLRYDLYSALAGLTSEVIAATGPTASPEDRVAQWERTHAMIVARKYPDVGDIDDSRANLAALAELVRQVRTLMRASLRA